MRDTPLGQGGDWWLTDEDVAWRPNINSEPLNWKQLKRQMKYEERLPTPQLAEVRGSAHQQRILDVVNERLMDRCYSMMGWSSKPRSVGIYQVLKRLRIPTIELQWREYLWFRMLHWEFRQWSMRISNKSHLSRQASTAALLAKLTLPRGERDRLWPHRVISGEPTNNDATILWRWLRARGRRMNRREWYDFTARFSGMPWRS